MMSQLHEGEQVLTVSEANRFLNNNALPGKLVRGPQPAASA